MRLNWVIGGIIMGIVVFIVANVMETSAPDALNGLSAWGTGLPRPRKALPLTPPLDVTLGENRLQ